MSSMKTSFKSVFNMPATLQRTEILLWGLLSFFAVAPLQAESLWLKAGSAAQSHYSDRRAYRAGDLLTIVVQETVNVTTSQETKADKDSTIDNSVTSFLFANSKLGQYKGEFPSTKTTGSNKYDGKGNITYNQAVSAKASVMVTDVLPNGNLLIEGLRAVSFANEKQYMVLRGVVRSEDVAYDNTIPSSLIANAYVEIKGEGDLSAAQHKGWLTKLNDFINPF